MPGIDFTRLRQQLSLAQVLDLVAFTATTRRGPQVRGPCPVHGSTTPRSRSFAAHLEKHGWHCFGCGACGNALDLYLAVTREPVYEAALELCPRLRLPVPRVPRSRVRQNAGLVAGGGPRLLAKAATAPRRPP